jgi:hypothetical protein
MSKVKFLCVAAFSLLVLVPGIATAQSAISGVVKDASGGVLPGVSIEASSPSLIEKVRTAVTDGNGVYRIIDLRPGVYTVVFTLGGFSTVRREGVELPDAFTATINADLRVGALEETITVTGESPVVDVQNPTQRNVLSNELSDALPAARFVHNYVNLIPGVTGATLGSVGTDQRKFQIHGGRIQDAIIAIDNHSVNMVPGFTSNSSFFTNQAMVEETTVMTAGTSAEQQFGGIYTNVVPKEGSNSFSFYLHGNYSSEGMSSSNLDDELRSRGLTAVNSTKLLYGVEPAAGGPIARDRLWFFSAARHSIVDRWRVVSLDKDPLDWVYTPDTSRPPHHSVLREDDYSLRLTWQVNQKDKILLYFDQQPHFFFQRNFDSTNPVAAPEQTNYTPYWPNVLYTATWKSPLTSRLFIDIGAGRYIRNIDTQPSRDPGFLVDPFSLVPARDSAINVGFRAGTGWSKNINQSTTGRVALSYVTGSHAFKFGWQWRHGRDDDVAHNSNDYSFTLANGVPRSIQQNIKPRTTQLRGVDHGLYVQDQWTRSRMTLNYGLRWDWLYEWVPAKDLAAGPFVGARSFPKIENVPNYKDLSPRFGVSYDLFGDGRTALKGAVNRYLVNMMTGIAGENDPLALTVTSTSRTWTDTDTDYEPDCDLANPLANGECRQVNNLNFGKTNPTDLGWNPDLLTGWGVRLYNWEVSTQISHELWPGASLNAGYFRRWYGGFTTEDNLAVGPADYSHYCVTAPVNTGLPGGGGHQICDLYDVSNATFGQVQNQTNASSKYGDRSEVYNGYDLSLNLRMGQGATFSGGLSTGQLHTVDCAVVDLPSRQYCDTKQPYQTQIKFLGRYPLPWWGLEVSGVFQSIPGPWKTATVVYTSSEIIGSLGRHLSAGPTSDVTVDVIQPNTENLDRQYQTDLRLGKTIRYQRYRVTANIEVNNLFNANGVQRFNARLSPTWPTPLDIQQPRIVQINAILQF